MTAESERVPTRLRGLVTVRPTVHADDRGFFLESYRRHQWAEMGITMDIVQSNHARSRRGTLRGLHYQIGQGQAKLVRCAWGAIFDVVVDIRLGSPTFGEWESFTLDDQAHLQLYIPVGFAHGYYVMTEMADVLYGVDSYYEPGSEAGLAWDDPEIGITWPSGEVIVSERDRSNPSLSDADGLPRWAEIDPAAG